MEAEQEQHTVWVKTIAREGGRGYVVSVGLGGHERVLTPDEAMRYIRTVLDAAARAEYDAAIMRQMTSVSGIGLQNAGEFMRDLRADRSPLDEEALAPLTLTPVVQRIGNPALPEMAPYVLLTLDGRNLGGWTPRDCRTHCLHVLTGIAGADLDSGYYRALTGIIGIEPDRAESVIADLQQYKGTEEP